MLRSIEVHNNSQLLLSSGADKGDNNYDMSKMRRLHERSSGIRGTETRVPYNASLYCFAFSACRRMDCSFLSDSRQKIKDSYIRGMSKVWL